MEPNSDKNSSRREWRRYSFLCFFFPFSPRVSDDPRRFSRVSTLGGGLGPLVTRLANVHKRRATRVLCDAVSTISLRLNIFKFYLVLPVNSDYNQYMTEIEFNIPLHSFRPLSERSFDQARSDVMLHVNTLTTRTYTFETPEPAQIFLRGNDRDP